MSFLSSLRHRTSWLATQLRHKLGWAETTEIVDHLDAFRENQAHPIEGGSIAEAEYEPAMPRPLPEPATIRVARREEVSLARIGTEPNNERPKHTWQQPQRHESNLGAYNGKFSEALAQITHHSEALVRELSVSRICALANRRDEAFRVAVAPLSADRLIRLIAEIQSSSAASSEEGVPDRISLTLARRLIRHGITIPPEPLS